MKLCNGKTNSSNASLLMELEDDIDGEEVKEDQGVGGIDQSGNGDANVLFTEVAKQNSK